MFDQKGDRYQSASDPRHSGSLASREPRFRGMLQYGSKRDDPKGRLGASEQSIHKKRLMRKRDLFYALLGCFLAPTAPSLAQDEIRWLDNYRETVQEAKRTQKPIFLEFRCEP